MKKYTTIKDLANHLKISTSTVSRALSDSWDVNADTRAKVLKAAEELNYKPNFLAKNLHHNKSGIVGLVIPEFTNSFFPELTLGIQEVLHANNYQLLITQSNESSEQELKNLEILEQSRVEGILLSCNQEGGNQKAYQRMINNGIPIVFFNRICKEIKAPKVIINDYDMAYKIVEHLILSGCKRIAHFSGPSTLSVSFERKKGYMDALKDYNLEIDERLIIEGGMTVKYGAAMMQQIMTSNISLPDGLFTFADPQAVGAIQELKKCHVLIPEEVAVAGFTESILSDIIEPNLSTVCQPTHQLGVEAANLLLEQLKGTRKIAPRTVCLEATLHIKQSTLKMGIF